MRQDHDASYGRPKLPGPSPALSRACERYTAHFLVACSTSGLATSTAAPMLLDRVVLVDALRCCCQRSLAALRGGVRCGASVEC